MTLSLTIHPVTEWLLIVTGGLAVLGPALFVITGMMGWELGSIVPWHICWVLAAITLILAVGSLL